MSHPEGGLVRRSEVAQNVLPQWELRMRVCGQFLGG